ncbi:MAG: hypothetical protein Q8P57_00650 [Candidatus Pacearchaeota archaeon]|nr:hypothetical protein [Candidatus Pacearchaeota archaeon]
MRKTLSYLVIATVSLLPSCGTVPLNEAYSIDRKALYEIASKSQFREQLNAILRHYDRNKDGVISKEEIDNFLRDLTWNPRKHE